MEEKEDISDPGWPDNDMLGAAWGLIANANSGDWNDEDGGEWVEAATKWRDAYHRYLKSIEENVNWSMVADRHNAWRAAEQLVGGIVDGHGLEPYKVGGTAFGPQGTTVTTVDQHIDHILRVADWLLETN